MRAPTANNLFFNNTYSDCITVFNVKIQIKLLKVIYFSEFL